MKISKWVLLGLVVAALALNVATAQVAGVAAVKKVESAPAPTTQVKEEPLRGEYAIMAKEAKLDEAQQAALKDKVKAKEAAMKAWKDDPAKAAKLAELQKSPEGPTTKPDEAKVKEIQAQIKTVKDAIKADKDQAEAKLDADILSVLKPEQKVAWQGFIMFRGAMRQFARVGLKEEQRDKLRSLCDAEAKKLAEVKDPKAVEKAHDDLLAKIKAEILTADQREAATRPAFAPREGRGELRERPAVTPIPTTKPAERR